MQPIEKARLQALRLLKVRPRSESELRERLGRQGVSAPVLETLIGEFKCKDFINDAKFAKYFATQRMSSRPVARRVLLSNLRARGVPSDLAVEAADEAVAETDELETARKLAFERAPHLKGLKRDAAQRRLFGFLSRRGFSSAVVYRVLREVGGAVPESLE